MLKKEALGVGAGLLIGLVGGKILNSKTAKKIAVSTVKQGLKIKDSLDKTVENIKLSSEDILAEAKDMKQKEEKEEKEKELNKNIEDLACEVQDQKAE